MPNLNFLQSGEAQSITVTTGTISAVSSLLVISIILRSPSKLTSSYHRIMFSLSFWDTLSSIAIALTTLPMSIDVLDVYDFVGIVRGNAASCTAQGLIIMIGQACGILSNVALNVYYVCTIRYKMTDWTVKHKLFPFMIVASCLIVIPMCTAPLVMGLFNPTPFEPYCIVGSYPYQCNWDDDGIKNDIDDDMFNENMDMDMECIRGDVSRVTEDTIHMIIMICIILSFLMVVVLLVLVVMSVFQTEMSLRLLQEEQEQRNRIVLDDEDEEEENDENDKSNELDTTNANVNPTDITRHASNINMNNKTKTNSNTHASTKDDRELEDLEGNVGSRRMSRNLSISMSISRSGRRNSFSSMSISRSGRRNSFGSMSSSRHRRRKKKKKRRRSSAIRIMDELKETRTVLLFALMYIGAFFLTWVFTILSMTILNWGDDSYSIGERIIDYGKVICAHSQGFFNALIFIANKMHMARKSTPSLTFFQALKHVVVTPSKVPEVLVSRVDMVEDDRRQKEEDRIQREENERIEGLIQADFAREKEEEEERQQQQKSQQQQQLQQEQELSVISPPSSSIPSNFLSLDTPSFALSNAISSHGIEKGMDMEEDFKDDEGRRDGDGGGGGVSASAASYSSSPKRRFYQYTPTKLLQFRGDTKAAAAASLDLDLDLDQTCVSGGTNLSNQPSPAPALGASSYSSSSELKLARIRPNFFPSNAKSSTSTPMPMPTPTSSWYDNGDNNNDANAADSSVFKGGKDQTQTQTHPHPHPPGMRRNVSVRDTHSNSHQHSGGGGGSVFTLNSLLSGFSSALGAAGPSAGEGESESGVDSARSRKKSKNKNKNNHDDLSLDSQ